MRTRPEVSRAGYTSLPRPSSAQSSVPAPVARNHVQQRGGYGAGDGFKRLPGGSLFGLRADPPPSREDPFRGLEGIELIRAFRSLVMSKKRRIEYTDVRKLIFTVIDNVGGQVTCAYTGRVRQANGVPDSDDMNIEHCWPQSKGAKGEAKCDMNHLMATDSDANGQRGNLNFGIVTSPKWEKGGSVLGEDASGELVFMPRKEVRGNVARAIFYFATVYGFAIDSKEEAILRQWHLDDPVDPAEIERTNRIEKEQGNPNYYVLFPKLLERIKEFPKSGVKVDVPAHSFYLDQMKAKAEAEAAKK